MLSTPSKKKLFYRGIIIGGSVFLLSFLCLGANLDVRLTFYMHSHQWNFFIIASVAVTFILVWCAITLIIGLKLLEWLDKLHVKIFGCRDTNLSEG